MVSRDLSSFIGSLRIAEGTQVEKDIKSSVEKAMRARLGLTGRAKLPGDVQTLIDSASSTAAAKALEVNVIKEVEDAARDATSGDVLARFTSKARLAEQGLAHIAGSSEVDKILQSRANLLAAKKKALEAAGFTSSEAMEIVLADIAARGH